MPNLSPALLIALLLLTAHCFTQAVHAAPDEASADKTLAKPRRTVESGPVPKEPLPNFHEVHPFLYRGGEPNALGLRKLKAMGVVSIIDLRAATPPSLAEEADAKTLDLKYTRLPMSNQPPTKAQVATFMEQTKEARDKNAPIYVHCAHGSDRTGCMIGIWRVTEDGYSFQKAYQEMRKYYFGPQFTLLSGAVRERAAK
jgi:tyrosine-protein phosphatase SIW14